MPLLYTPKLLKHYNKKVWTEWMRERARAKERRHPSKWSSKVAAAAEAPTTLRVCVLKNYIAGAVLHNGWIAFLSKISMNMSIIKIIFKAKITKNANTWDLVKRRNAMALRVLAAQHSSEEKLLTLAVSSRFSHENEVLELQFSCLREIYALTPSLCFPLGSFLCLCFYL